jgi:hypothetical protein
MAWFPFLKIFASADPGTRDEVPEPYAPKDGLMASLSRLFAVGAQAFGPAQCAALPVAHWGQYVGRCGGQAVGAPLSRECPELPLPTRRGVHGLFIP